jgi:bacillithiol synthase
VHSECLPFSNIPHSTRLFTDYLSYSGNTRDFYPRPPFLPEWAADEATRLNYPADRRQKVAELLERQNRAFGSDTKTHENLQKFREGAAVVVTGQQVGLAGGPLFAILKALTAVKLARQAEAAGVPCVPVFWLATEDHDLEEVNHTFVPTADASLAEVKCSCRGVEDAPVGDIRFGDEIVPIVEQLTQLLGPSEITDALQSSYRPGETMGSAFGKLFASIFRDWGVILIDAYDPEFHRLAEPIYRAAIERSGELDDLLIERGKQLEAAGYHAQVKVTNTSTPLFEIKNGQRTVIHRSNDHFKVGEDRCSREELLHRISASPDKFSANVLLRPIMQDYLLPTLAYTGGPAEVAYFAQVAVVYEQLLGRVTPVLPRFSATVVEPKQGKFLEKYGLKLTDLFHGEERLRIIMAQNVLSSSMQRDFAEASGVIARAMDKIRAGLQQLDPTLLDAANTAESKMKYQVEQLEGRAARAQLKRDEVIERHAKSLSTHLFPNKELQEREIAGVYFLAKQGLSILDSLYEAASHDCPDHQVVYL